MKIFCVGRNYIKHARELGNEVPTEPIIFIKPSTALVENNRDFKYPNFSKKVHHEAELVLRIAKNGTNIPESKALSFVDGMTIGIDFTARDIQDRLKEKRLSWEISKGFDGAAPVGEFIPFNNGRTIYSLKKNKKKVQTGNTDNLIFSFSVLINFISRYFILEKGDLIFTGTPEDVGPVIKGDLLEGFIEDKKLLTCKIV